MEGQQKDKQPAQEKQELGPDGKPLSKKALKKLEKEKQKEEQKAKKQAQAAPQEEEATSGENWGLKEPVRSATREGKHFVRLSEITPALSGQTVLFRARLQNIRAKGNLAFLFLRQRSHSIQAVAAKSEKISKSMLKWLAGIPKESLVDVTGTVKEGTVEKATQHNVEIEVASVFVVSLSVPTLPLQIEDAERPRAVFEAQEAEVAAIQAEIDKHKATLTPEQIKAGDAHLAELEKKKESAVKFPAVKEDTRLDNRILDLRTCTSQAVFTIQSGVVQLFKEALLGRGFTEIHSPKLIGTASEGGAEVFEVKYFDRKAYLAQSPQLYKQMAVCGDLERVFEIGPVFRAEKSFTHRHLTEFVGLDLEMAFYEHYYEVLDVLEAMLLSIFKGLKEKFAHEIEVVKRQYPFEDFQIAEPVPRVKFSDAIAMLREAGETIGDYDDLSTPQERKLGALVKQKYKTDFYVLDKFPLAVRPFYTMPDPANPNYSNSYDLFMRGEEICSGAQRVHIPELLEERAKAKGVGLEGIRPYIEAFRYGAPPHAGGGIGLERVVMLYLNLGNIRRSSLFPRDPVRLAP